MRYRKLRIAWSLIWGIAATLMIAVGMRSYGHYEQITNSRGECIVESWRGRLWILPGPLRSLGTGLRTNTRSGSEYEDILQRLSITRPTDIFGFNTQAKPVVGLCFPHWFASSVLLAVAVAPWVRHRKWKFTIRTL